MAIDIGVLRKFQETWAPVMDAIPVVMEMVAKEADNARAMAQAKRDFENAQAGVRGIYEEAERYRADAQKEIDALVERKKQLQDNLSAAIVAADAKARAVEQEADARIRNAQERTTQAETRVAEVQAEIEKQEAAVRAAHAEALQAVQAEAEALEKRKATAEKALESLRTKLG